MILVTVRNIVFPSGRDCQGGSRVLYKAFRGPSVPNPREAIWVCTAAPRSLSERAGELTARGHVAAFGQGGGDFRLILKGSMGSWQTTCPIRRRGIKTVKSTGLQSRPWPSLGRGRPLTRFGHMTPYGQFLIRLFQLREAAERAYI